jgi:hypothetical protein
MRSDHHVKYFVNVVLRHLDVKQIAHGVHEDPLRLSPSQWPIQHLRLQGQLETVSVVVRAHRFEAAGHSARVAVLAAGAGIVATRYRVPRRLRPFDCRLGHFA